MALNRAREPQVYVPGCRVTDLRGALPTRQDAPPYEIRALTAITLAVIHYSGVDADSTATEIADYQTTKTDGDLFPEIAYHFVVHQTGQIEQCHDLMVRAWHAGSLGNDRGVAICLPMLKGPTPLQAEATARLIAALGGRLGRTLKVVGHKELSVTQCPGEGWETWRALLLRPRPPADRQLTVDGVPVKWAFYDWYKRLETLKPGLCGAPTAAHTVAGDGSASQTFSGCTMLWREGQMWISFKGPPN